MNMNMNYQNEIPFQIVARVVPDCAIIFSTHIHQNPNKIHKISMRFTKIRIWDPFKQQIIMG
jgi:hypothetical protein